MVRPGVQVVNRATPPAAGFAPSTWFAAGITEKGPIDTPVIIHNLSEYGTWFGSRVSYGTLYDPLDVFFREGGAVACVSRVVGPDAAVDTVTLADAGDDDSIAVDSIGAWDSGLTVEVAAGVGAGTFILIIANGDDEVERSPDLLLPSDAVAWSSGSAKWVRVRALGSLKPAVVGATPLTGGDDDRGNITDDERAAALDRIGSGFGEGQVSYPGATTAAVHVALLNHAASKNRIALLDAADTSNSDTLLTSIDTLRAETNLVASGGEYGAYFAPWVVVPGIASGTTRTVAPSAVVAGLIARRDAETGNTNEAAAGANGVSRYAIGLSQPAFADADREALNAAGVDVLRVLDNAVRLYGYRTIASAPAATSPWQALTAARLRMSIVADAEAVGEAFLFSQLDGKGLKVAEFNGALAGMLNEYWGAGALYGQTADDAYTVDTGATVNTPTTLEANELHAVLAVRVSPFAELVYIEIAKVPVTEALIA